MTDEFSVISPEVDDVVVLQTEDDEIPGSVIAWGIERWGKFWAVLDCGGTTYVNLDKVSTFFIVDDDDDEEEDGEEEECKVHLVDFKNKRKEKVAPQPESSEELSEDPNGPFAHVEAGPFKESKPVFKVEAKIDPKNGVVEPEVDIKDISPEELPEKLEELYLEKKKALEENIKDHLSNEEIKDSNTNYEMPSFKKRP